jgi:hypothetical protein
MFYEARTTLRAGEFDTPGVINKAVATDSLFSNTSYGALVSSGTKPDQDVYYIGSFFAGNLIKIAVSAEIWDSDSPYFGMNGKWTSFNPTIYIYDKTGNQIASGKELLTINIFSQIQGDFYIGIEGSGSSSSQYSFNWAVTNIAVSPPIVTPPVIAIPPTIIIEATGNYLDIEHNNWKNKTYEISFLLSKPSSDFVVGDIDVYGCTLSNFIGNGSRYSALLTVDEVDDYSWHISVGSRKFTDEAGNFNEDGLDGDNFVSLDSVAYAWPIPLPPFQTPSDTTPPSIKISTAVSKLGINDTSLITFTLSEPYTNFRPKDINVAGGKLSNFSGVDGIYYALFTPTENSKNDGVISVVSGAFQDKAGSKNIDGLDADNTVTISIDTKPAGKIFSGFNLDDQITGTFGNDTIDGGLGFDTITFNKSSDSYSLNHSELSDFWRITDKTGTDGSDTFINIEQLVFSDRKVMIESRAHLSYADLPPELYQFFIVAFNAAPGVTYMDQLAEAYRYGMSVKEILNIYTTKTQFTDAYPSSLNNLELATLLVNNIVKNSANDTTKAEGILDLKNALDFGLSKADVVYNVFGNLAKLPLIDPIWNAKWGNTAKQFSNEITVAKFYTEVLNQSTTDLETLRDAIQPVSQSTDVSSDTVVAQLIGMALMTGGVIPGP